MHPPVYGVVALLFPFVALRGVALNKKEATSSEYSADVASSFVLLEESRFISLFS